MRTRNVVLICLVALLLAVAPLRTANAQETILVRAGEHEDRTRLVFDFKEQVSYSASIESDILTISFDRPAVMAFSELERIDPVEILRYETRLENGGTVFEATLVGGITLAEFRDGTHIAIDLVTGQADPQAAKTETETPKSEPVPAEVDLAALPHPPEEPVSTAQRLEAEIEPASGAAAEAVQPTEKPDAATSVAPKAPAEVQVAVAADIPLPLPAEPKTVAKRKPDPAPAQDSPIAGLPVGKPETTETAAPALAAPSEAESVAAANAEGPQQPITVEMSRTREGFALHLKGSHDTRAAIFKRGSYMWAVLDSLGPTTMEDLPVEFRPQVKGMEEIVYPQARILRFKIDPRLFPIARMFSDGWVIELKPYVSQPLEPLEVHAQGTRGVDVRLFVPVPNGEPVYTIKDPTVGDVIVIAPALPAGRGMAAQRHYAELELLETAQGLVVKPLTPQIVVTHVPKGFAVTKQSGLLLSKIDGPIPFDEDDPTVAQIAAPDPVVDLAKWRLGPAEDYVELRQGLLRELAIATDDQRADARWNLARFYLGHHMVPESLALMEMMVRDDSSLGRDPDFLAARGIAQAFMGRYNLASADLTHSSLRFEPHAALWRATALAGAERWKEAYIAYEEGSAVLPRYEDKDRAAFLIVGAKAALETGDLDSMPVYLNMLAETDLTERQAVETDYLQARLEEIGGADKSALLSYERVIAADVRPLAARAEYAHINLALKAGKTSRETAIDRLERLRFIWRGDSLELATLNRIGELYVENGNYRQGLLTMRMAATYFGHDDGVRHVVQGMEDIFRNLFLRGDADNISPLAALALYYDFKELTPIGSEGDVMIRKLAQRLVGVDLLGRAADLLKHQVDHRLQGVAQAQVATQLALVYLSDKKPKEALDVIRKTAQPLLPEEIRVPRRQLIARALMDMDRLAEAESSLIDDPSNEATLLRSDIYWLQQDWPKVAKSGAAILADRWKNTEPLSEVESQQILRQAVALSLMKDDSGLQLMRERFLPIVAESQYAEVFDAITERLNPGSSRLGDLVSRIANVSSFEAVLANYRTRFADGNSLN